MGQSGRQIQNRQGPEPQRRGSSAGCPSSLSGCSAWAITDGQGWDARCSLVTQYLQSPVKPRPRQHLAGGFHTWLLCWVFALICNVILAVRTVFQFTENLGIPRRSISPCRDPHCPEAAGWAQHPRLSRALPELLPLSLAPAWLCHLWSSWTPLARAPQCSGSAVLGGPDSPPVYRAVPCRWPLLEIHLVPSPRAP